VHNFLDAQHPAAPQAPSGQSHRSRRRKPGWFVRWLQRLHKHACTPAYNAGQVSSSLSLSHTHTVHTRVLWIRHSSAVQAQGEPAAAAAAVQGEQTEQGESVSREWSGASIIIIEESEKPRRTRCVKGPGFPPPWCVLGLFQLRVESSLYSVPQLETFDTWADTPCPHLFFPTSDGALKSPSSLLDESLILPLVTRCLPPPSSRSSVAAPRTGQPPPLLAQVLKGQV